MVLEQTMVLETMREGVLTKWECRRKSLDHRKMPPRFMSLRRSFVIPVRGVPVENLDQKLDRCRLRSALEKVVIS